ncbi:MAG TPA: hypothetical protein VF796_06675 [Humisphaera sp.]
MTRDPLSRRSLLAAAAAAAALAVARPGLSQATVPASGTRPARKPGTRKDVPPRMSFLANDRLKLGVDLALGGAITHLSPAGDPATNLINSWDLGRQVQMSYYAGPVPYEVPGHAGPPEHWRHIGWNPIQVGDDYGNPGVVLEHRNDGRELYVKCRPMQWPLDDVPGECAFELWATLDGPAARVRCRLTMSRSDRTQYPARTQELPAVYTNGPWHRLFTYAGEKPFEGDDLTLVKKRPDQKGPWSHWLATENWAALVDDADWGLGVWNPGCVAFSGGFSGKPGAGGPKDSPTGYIAPNRNEVLDHDCVHEYAYALVLGDLRSIRTWVYAQPRTPTPPAWVFEKDRNGWTYTNATDGGWPVKGELDVDLSGRNPQLVSPVVAWTAADAPKLTIDAAVTGSVSRVAVYWATAADGGFSPKRVAILPVKPDGQGRPYEVDLSKLEGYRGLITQLRIDPQPSGTAGDRVRVKAVRLGR